MTELRAGRSLSLVPGLTTLYEVVPGEDRKADVCIGMVATTELAELIVGAVNGELPQVEAAERAHDQRIKDLQQEMGRRIEPARRNAARAERERCITLLATADPLEFLTRHGLQPGAGPAAVLAAAAAEIEGRTDG